MPRLYTAFLIFLLLFNLASLNLNAAGVDAQQPASSAAPSAQKLHIDIVQGDGQLINIKARINPSAIVEVLDENNKPVPGAAVVFLLPAQGPGGTFIDGSNNKTVTTGRDGRAAAAGIIPNTQTGDWEIRVNASYQGQTASAVITQTNVSGVSASSTGGVGISKKGLIILVVVAGAVAGAVVGARAAGGGSGSTPGAGIIISAGSPTVGAPH